MSINAYGKVALQADSPRQAEYRLFAQVTSALIEASAPEAQVPERVEALHRNRQMWTAMATDCMNPGNALPEATRASIISLGLWVNRYTVEVLRDSRPVEPLIDVNRSIMKGLDGRPAVAA